MKFKIVLCLLCLAGILFAPGIFAQDVSADPEAADLDELFLGEDADLEEIIVGRAPRAEGSTGVSFGIGPEVNNLADESVAVGGSFLFSLDLNPSISLGLNFGFYNDLDALSTLIAQAFFRYYLPVGQEYGGLFLQADAGTAIALFGGEATPAFSGGASAGWRFNFGNSGYVELAARGGWPYLWAAGVNVGLRFRRAAPSGISQHLEALEIYLDEGTDDLDKQESN